MELSLNQEQLKDIIKAALVEVLEERQDLLHDALEEALEDVAIIRAIQEGENTGAVSREEIFKILNK